MPESGGDYRKRHQYTGRENDGTGLYYYRARYYSPGLQQFISEDPVGLSLDGFNTYKYVYDDPTNLIDPSGEIPVIVAVGLAGGTFGAIDQVLTAYSQGQRGLALLTPAGQGFVAGGVAAVVAGLAFGATGNPYAAGAATAAMYDLGLDIMRKQMLRVGNMALDAALGGSNGRTLGSQLEKMFGRKSLMTAQ
jgi:RHS repeat-associated protein